MRCPSWPLPRASSCGGLTAWTPGCPTCSHTARWAPPPGVAGVKSPAARCLRLLDLNPEPAPARCPGTHTHCPYPPRARSERGAAAGVVHGLSPVHLLRPAGSRWGPLLPRNPTCSQYPAWLRSGAAASMGPSFLLCTHRAGSLGLPPPCLPLAFWSARAEGPRAEEPPSHTPPPAAVLYLLFPQPIFKGPAAIEEFTPASFKALVEDAPEADTTWLVGAPLAAPAELRHGEGQTPPLQPDLPRRLPLAFLLPRPSRLGGVLVESPCLPPSFRMGGPLLPVLSRAAHRPAPSSRPCMPSQPLESPPFILSASRWSFTPPGRRPASTWSRCLLSCRSSTPPPGCALARWTLRGEGARPWDSAGPAAAAALAGGSGCRLGVAPRTRAEWCQACRGLPGAALHVRYGQRIVACSWLFGKNQHAAAVWPWTCAQPSPAARLAPLLRWPQLAAAHKVQVYGALPHLPTFIEFNGGKEVGRIPHQFEGEVSAMQALERRQAGRM